MQFETEQTCWVFMHDSRSGGVSKQMHEIEDQCINEHHAMMSNMTLESATIFHECIRTKCELGTKVIVAAVVFFLALILTVFLCDQCRKNQKK